jgi:hypothetical protein
VTYPFTTLGPALDEPLPHQPVDQPIRDQRGNPPMPVLVHEELGIPIYFDPNTQEFSAQISGVHGRGESSKLHSQDFKLVIERIRQRALVTPIEAYLVSVNYWDDTAPVSVTPCTVLEYHPRRFQPFVIRLLERVAHQTKLIPRIRSASQVYLPQPEHLERVTVTVLAQRAEDRRHEEEKRRLEQEVKAALLAIPQLNAQDVRSVQKDQQQVAQSAEALGVAVYDATPDEEEASA